MEWLGEGRCLAGLTGFTVEDAFTGAAVLITGIGGIVVAVHEWRRRERRVTRAEIEDLTQEVDALRHLLLEQRRYIYIVVMAMIDHGIDVPQPPAPSFDPGEYDEEAP